MSNYVEVTWPGDGGVAHFALSENYGSGEEVWLWIESQGSSDQETLLAAYETQHEGVEYWEVTIPPTTSGWDESAVVRCYAVEIIYGYATLADLWICGNYTGSESSE